MTTSDDTNRMTCEHARELISAEVDGQLAESERAELLGHLASCGACADWQSRLADRTRLAVVTPVGAVAATRPAPLPDPRLAQRNRIIRVALAWAGVLLIGWHVPAVFTAGAENAVHLSRHQAAFAVALGAGFVFVAARPERAFGVIPFVASFTVALTVTAVVDLLNGSSNLLTESRHLLEIGGLVLVWILGVGSGPRRRRRASTLRDADGGTDVVTGSR
ncbi:MAG: zf-HC2 domain-containing protein [Acidimicrobiia bacterium]